MTTSLLHPSFFSFLLSCLSFLPVATLVFDKIDSLIDTSDTTRRDVAPRHYFVPFSSVTLRLSTS